MMHNLKIEPFLMNFYKGMHKCVLWNFIYILVQLFYGTYNVARKKDLKKMIHGVDEQMIPPKCTV